MEHKPNSLLETISLKLRNVDVITESPAKSKLEKQLHKLLDEIPGHLKNYEDPEHAKDAMTEIAEILDAASQVATKLKKQS